MSALHDALTEYLRTRRALGTKLAWPESSLRKFVNFIETEGQPFVTTESAVRWATQSVGVQQATHARRLGLVRGFAVWLQATDMRTQVPPHGLLPHESAARSLTSTAIARSLSSWAPPANCVQPLDCAAPRS